MTASTPPPAGWYLDQQIVGAERWWDGYRWTEHTRPLRQVLPYAGPAAPTRYITTAPVHTSHVFHLIMTILTFGFWGVLVWLPMTIINKMRHEKTVTRVS